MVNDPNPPPNHFTQSLKRDDDTSHKSDYYDLNSKIMLTAIISLSFVVVLVTILHIYARCLLRRQARRRAALQHLSLAVHTPEPPKTGLDPAVIAGLPIFPFTQKDAKDEAGQTECAVCLSTLESGEIARLLPNCNHTFHAECINTWLTSQSTCPICRAEAEPRGHPVAIATHAALPSAPSIERGNFTSTGTEGTSEGKTVSGSSSRLSSFRRILSRERSSSRIIPPCGEEAGTEDLERQ